MSPKYPGAEQDYPLVFQIEFNFDKNYEEAKLAYQSLQDAIKRGTPATISAKFINHVKFPDLIDPEIFGYDEFKPDELFIVPEKQNRSIPCAIKIIGQNDEILAQIPHVEFKEKYSGTEEITFSNEHQKSPITFLLQLNTVDHKASITFSYNFLNINAFQAFDVMKIQKAFFEGSWLVASHALTNISLMKYPIPENLVSSPLPILFEVARNLSFIQEKTRQIIEWPKKISYDDKDLIEEIVSIIKTGQSKGGNYIGFGLKKVDAKKMLSPFDQTVQRGFRMEAKERYVNLFGKKIILGPVTIIISRARPNIDTLNRIRSIELPDDAIVQVELEIDDPGIEYYHHDWMPKWLLDDINQKYSIETHHPDT